MAVSSVLTLFRMQALLTLSIVGGYLLGALGAWRIATVFPLNRARIAGMVVYVATPLVPGLLSRGDWSALVWYAALPWLVHLVRRAAGLEAADPTVADLDITDGVAPVGWRHRAARRRVPHARARHDRRLRARGRRALGGCRPAARHSPP